MKTGSFPTTFEAKSLLSTTAFAVVGVAIAMSAQTASAEIVGESVVYEIDGEVFEGYLSRNTALDDEDRPTVLIIHDWDGVTDYEMQRAEMLAQSGYTAFAIDVYGQGVRPQSVEESQAASGAMYQDRETFQERLMGGLAALSDLDGVDDDNVIVIGYCFGGAAVLEMARAGADVDGFVVFHGGLGTPEGQTYDAVDAPMLLLHGSADPVAPMSQLAELTASLDTAGVDYQAMVFGGAQHAFSVWSSGDYDLQADQGSWRAMIDFLEATYD